MFTVLVYRIDDSRVDPAIAVLASVKPNTEKTKVSTMNNRFAQLLFNSTGGYAALILRVPVGVILMAHGSQKLFGWFGGYGLAGTGQWMASIGLEPGYLMALLAGSAEFFGGLALVLGLLTRPAALVTAFTMLVAIFSVHIGNGLFLAHNGFEYALSLLAVTSALLVQGAGYFAVDNLLSARFNQAGAGHNAGLRNAAA